MFTSDKGSWQWEKELAVVTGGSNGIGAAVVRELVSFGIRVAVLDVQPLSEELQNGVLSCHLGLALGSRSGG